MGFKCGIVGLPNVGKSTLFNALTRTAAAQAANFPFCTIEPNVGEVSVPDERLETIAGLAHSKTIIPTRITFVDIAGLVRGASKGEGLGNQFLGNIREVDAIIHVLRAFENEGVTHVEGQVDPLADAQTIETELMLADLESLEHRAVNIRKKAQAKDKEALEVLPLIDQSLELLQKGLPARLVKTTKENEKLFKSLQLLTSKPVLYVCNVEEASAVSGNALTQKIVKHAEQDKAQTVLISAALEAEIALMEPEDQTIFLGEMGLEQSGLERLITAGYALLDLVTYFTAGPKETRAWTVTKGTKAPQAAGVIHSDFERGFIRAQTISYDDYIACKGEQKAKESGKARDEGKEYVVKDGDVMLFKFNV